MIGEKYKTRNYVYDIDYQENDALVSKRYYKNPMSHEEACEVIRDSMGTHFDPMLKECFEKSSAEIAGCYSKEYPGNSKQA